MKKLFIILGILGVLGALGYLGFKQFRGDTVHYHAGFVVFDNGVKVDFSSFKYMELEPCTKDDSKKDEDTPEHEQKEKAHLHDGVGDVVHVHRASARWGDLFTNINYPLDFSKVTAFVNGKKVENIKDYPIKAYDSVVFFVGSVDEKLLSQAVTIDHIKDVEGRSETCGN